MSPRSICSSHSLIYHAAQLAGPLFSTLRYILHDVCGIPIPTLPVVPILQAPPAIPAPPIISTSSGPLVDIQWIHSNAADVASQYVDNGKRNHYGPLAHGEMVLTF